MSRIGKRTLTFPENVNVNVENNVVTVKGPKGELSLELVKNIEVKVEGNTVTVEPSKNDKFTHAMHGTTNANIKNMIIGVTEGYKKALEIVGVGYKFNVQGTKLTVNAGYSHPVVMEVPAGLTVKQINNTEIEIEGIDKIKVGEFAANVRKVRGPEPYKGKGIKYKGEQIRRKEGKKASK
jgi:large subunit ribosomal protein L6